MGVHARPLGVGLRMVGAIGLLTGLLTVAITFPLGAQVLPKEDKEKTRPTPVKVPSGGIIVVTDKVTDTLQKGDAIYLTPEKYLELVEQNEQLKKQVQAAEKAVPPSECRLEARLETRGSSTVVRVRATLRFKTILPRSAVFLGFQNSQPLDPKLDDNKLPLLIKTEQGLTVLVENEGEHVLKLELETPLASRGSKGTETGFELGLPGAPITLLTVGLPARAKRVTVVRREVGVAIPETRNFAAEQLKPDGEGLPLGALTGLDLFWDDEGVAPRDPQRTAQAEVTMTVGEAELVTETRLRLSGSAKEWKFTAPATAEVQIRKAPAPADLAINPANRGTELPFEQAPTIVRPEPNQPPIWKLQFREPNPADLLVLMNVRQPRPTDGKAKSPIPIGAYAALEVSSQSGTIRVRTPPQVRVAPLLRGDTRRQDSGDDPLAETVFRYTQLPPGPNNLPGTPLEIELRTLPGSIQTNTSHQLQQVERGWRLTTEIQVTPVRLDLDRVELELPSLADFLEPRFGPATAIEGVTPLRDVAPNRRVVLVKLLTPQRGPFNLTVEGVYPTPPAAQNATFNLPRLLNSVEKDSQVAATLPEGLELKAAVRVWLHDAIGTWKYPLQGDESRSSVTLNRATPAQVELLWKPQSPRFRIESVADLTLIDGVHRVQQQIKCIFEGRVPAKLRWKLSDGGLLRTGVAVSNGTLEFLGDSWQWIVPPSSGNEVTLKTTFAFREEDWRQGRTLRVPLFWAEGATQGETRVRIWRDAASTLRATPSQPSENWNARPLEIIPEEKSLPLRVLSTFERYAPLNLELIPEAEGGMLRPSIQAWAERVLLQVQVLDGVQRNRLRLPLRKWSVPQLELELPGGSGEVEVFLGGRRVEWTEANRAVVIPLPAPTGEPLMLEVRYLSPVPSGWSWKFAPPRFRGSVSMGAVRWQVATPSRIALLCLGEGVVFEERWTLRNGLPTAVAGRGASELELWLTSGAEQRSTDAPRWEMGEGTLTFRQSQFEAIRFLALPRLLWIILVSLGVLVLGGMLAWRSSATVWLWAALLGIVGIVLFFFFPQLIRQLIAASLPGILVLVLVGMIQRTMERRYRWRLAHMPAFRRPPTEPSGGRGSSTRPINPLTREPSTIDSPPT